MNRLLPVLFLAPVFAFGVSPGWQQHLSPSAPGTFPLPRPQRATYRFGWLGLTAGTANTDFARIERTKVRFTASGGSTGLVRRLWKLDAGQTAIADSSSLSPIRVTQVESYSSKTVTTNLDFDGHGVTSLRSQIPPDANPATRQHFKFPDVRDLQCGLLYVRSQRLRTGDDISLVAYPSNAPYLVSIHVIGREKIHVAAGDYSALKIEVHLHNINSGFNLEPHKKFKRAFAWLSDDADRLLLRVEAEIFVGSVWVELQTVTFTGS